ncbi:MAG TPA: hypothetical protein VGD99_02330 [Anaerolineae bacterium]|jgi:hypothetical protein
MEPLLANARWRFFAPSACPERSRRAQNDINPITESSHKHIIWLDDLQLVEALRAGDEAAFVESIARKPGMNCFGFFAIGKRNPAEGAMNDALLTTKLPISTVMKT